jgi:hypothetical protein
MKGGPRLRRILIVGLLLLCFAGLNSPLQAQRVGAYRLAYSSLIATNAATSRSYQLNGGLSPLASDEGRSSQFRLVGGIVALRPAPVVPRSINDVYLPLIR